MFEEVLEFYEKIKTDGNHRYHSWEHCYTFFQSQEKTNNDLAALNLGFYLASWGMYRGSSFLLQKDYKVHTGAIKIIEDKEYKDLQGIYLEGFKEDKTALLFELIEKLRAYYKSIKDSVPYLANDRAATDTLITKVLMGTLGCIPAYDRFFTDGIRSTKQIPYGTLNETNFEALLKWCQDNPIPDNIRGEIPKLYPDMKIVDMYFWRIGEKKWAQDAKEKAEKEISLLGKGADLTQKEKQRKAHLEEKLKQYEDILK
jgi:hypothetical protein